MTIHIGAKPGEIAETVLMPGDPLRARWVAETFLQDAALVTEIRGMLGYSGTWKGHPVTVQGSGMGMPSLSIYANELIRDYGARTLIRIGSAGAMQEGVRIRDVVLGMSACTTGSPSRTIFRELNYAPTADFGLLKAAWEAGQAIATARGITVHAGQIHSSDTFYDERADLDEQMRRHGVLCVEMEAAELYTLAARYGCRALAVLTISDHLLTHEALPPDQRETSFCDMVEIALTAAFA
ncbi:MAG: purine-nucleoside phosphorylase [Gemmobacter sp.]|jgi:purine-nucleoside phosphorylase|nr:purine-nucleoside phosphorylase [Gemmobacter sp.]